MGVPNSGEEVYSRLNADRQIDGQISHFDFIFAVTVLFTWVYLSFSPLLFTFLLFTAICKSQSLVAQKTRAFKPRPRAGHQKRIQKTADRESQFPEVNLDLTHVFVFFNFFFCLVSQKHIF